MNQAIYQNEMISLSTMKRELYQSLYEESQRGLVTCAHCHESVKLYIGMEKKPYFYHALKPYERPECIKSIEEKEQKKVVKETKPAYRESAGFRLPTSRAISGNTATIDVSFTKTKALVSQSSFKTRRGTVINYAGLSLDIQQEEAVKKTEGPLLVLAGAGSGKTRVLTARAAYLLVEKKVDPSSIMLVTFTTKAAQEMKERLRSYEGIQSSMIGKMVVGTFHSIFYRILSYHKPQDWRNDRLMKWEWQREKFVKIAARELDIEEEQFPFDQALNEISYWKNTLILPSDVKPENQWEKDVQYLYRRYEEMRIEQGMFDFDDMLLGCYELLKENEEIRSYYQDRFQYFLVDEFQDINLVQYEIMKLLSAKSQNICVVGDDDQSIYAFRGSNPSFIRNFSNDNDGTQIVTLSENYRSSHAIVDGANAVIKRNKDRYTKKMRAQFENEFTPLSFSPYDEEEEATMIVTDIKEKIEQGADPSDFAILYRTHTMSRALFERLSSSNLPFSIDYGADSFYNRRMIKAMLAFLRLSINENDQEALGQLLPALFLKASALNDVKALSILHDCSYVEALIHLTNLQSFQKRKLMKLVPLFSTLKNRSPLGAIDIIEKEMGFNQFVKKRGNEGNAIEKGSDDIRDLKVVAKKFNTVKQFIEHADHMKAMNEEMKKLSKTFPSSITLTTIHRAKGLEYNHVYILGVVDGALPHDYALDAYRNGDEAPLEEERRLLYVAMTRAKQSLFLSIPEHRRGKKAHPSRFLKGLF
ncbi:ATP-dependent helicase [Priestia endophytica]|uniref:ATP-dependent helicase n=1 Tax=Priestia endophytica TaxID=135735 RepID=UPI000DCA65B0|nr:ATP-dependent helicase [Priestia endophytica]RAS73820.1 ATP-dependent DNA helicase Rep [Priestia endophytica]